MLPDRLGLGFGSGQGGAAALIGGRSHHEWLRASRLFCTRAQEVSTAGEIGDQHAIDEMVPVLVHQRRERHQVQGGIGRQQEVVCRTNATADRSKDQFIKGTQEIAGVVPRVGE